MSSQTIKQPLVGGISTGGNTWNAWLKQIWAKLLLGKKKLLLGGGFMAAVVLAGFYFWGDDTSTPQYMTARVERERLQRRVHAKAQRTQRRKGGSSGSGAPLRLCDLCVFA